MLSYRHGFIIVLSAFNPWLGQGQAARTDYSIEWSWEQEIHLNASTKVEAIKNMFGDTNFLGGGPLSWPTPKISNPGAKILTMVEDTTLEPHEALFLKNRFPSATQCQPCHSSHYKEWSVSPHAYALLSPVFNAMQAKVIKLTNGTTGDFCIRCHTPAGMSAGEPIVMPTLERAPVSREGVTCISCHRRKQEYGKVSGRIGVVEGDLFEPVYGSEGNKELKRVIESGEYEVNAERNKEGRQIHSDARRVAQITSAGYCGSCHDVNSVDGFRFEETFSEYKASKAIKSDFSCQDCHMGLEPGVPSGYGFEPIAIVGGKPTKPRKRTNHMFIGPDHSIVHPALFPHNPAIQSFAGMEDWLEFDHQAGWGTDAFEDNVDETHIFPARWSDISDRYEARDLINENEELLEKARIERLKLLQVGYQLGEIVVEKVNDQSIKFRVEFKNGTSGHNVPTGFDAERIVFLQIVVTDASGKVIFQSGDLDPNGDVRDSHSLYVHNGELEQDDYLFSLQSNFLVSMARGGDREQVLPINYSQSPLPFVRPATSPIMLQGRPNTVRKHRQTIAPLDNKWAHYQISKSQLAGTTGPYVATIKLIAGMVPVNLVHEIQDVGFEFGASPRDIADAVVAGHSVLWEYETVLEPGSITVPIAVESKED